MPSTILSVDVSSYQTPSLPVLGQWIAAGCQLLWVHSYHSYEQASLQASTRAWVATARQAGVWCLPYCWLFRGFSGRQAVRESIELFREADMPPKIVALDAEDYGSGLDFDPGPTAEQVLAAAGEARSMGVEVVLYSNKPWLDGMDGDHEILRGIPAWIANYNDDETLNVPAPDWVDVLGHQYTSTPVDWSVFDLEALQALSNPHPPDPCTALRAELKRLRDAKPYAPVTKRKLASLLSVP